MSNGGTGGGGFGFGAPFQVEIEKVFQGEFWVNRYFVNAASLGDAQLVGSHIVAAERVITSNRITFTKMSTRTTTRGDYVYTTSVLNLLGLRNFSDVMPLFVVARVDFQAAAGRPSRKYLRGVLMESDVDVMTVSAARVTAINTDYAQVLAALAGFVDVDNDDIVGGACSPITGMRQLRRGSKKRRIP